MKWARGGGGAADDGSGRTAEPIIMGEGGSAGSPMREDFPSTDPSVVDNLGGSGVAATVEFGDTNPKNARILDRKSRIVR